MTSLIALLCLVVSALPSPYVRDDVAIVELNHVVDLRGRPSVDQLIFWEVDLAGEKHVRDWALVTANRADRLRPRVHTDGTYVVRFRDCCNVLRDIRAPQFVESWTQDDPELADSKRCEAEGFQRRPLSSPLPIVQISEPETAGVQP